MNQNKSLPLEIVILLVILLTVGCTASRDSVWTTNKIPTMVAVNEKIAFVHRDENTLSENIYVVNVDGSGLRPLTTEKNNTINPDWSPDGEHIVFSALTNGVNQIYKIKSDGSDLRQLTFGDYSSYNPAWSRDGKYLLFLSLIGDSSADNGLPLQQGYIMNSDGSEQRRLTDGSSFVTAISWYKDNNLISVSSADTRYKLRVRVIDSNGTVQDQIPEFIIDGSPNWSPNGETIVYTPFVVRVNCSGIVLFSISNFKQECIVIDPIVPPAISKTPSWSPDGQYIIFSSNRDGDFDLYITKIDGSELEQVTNMPGDELSPVWAP
jgi:Tol biopolymer transport system component